MAAGGIGGWDRHAIRRGAPSDDGVNLEITGGGWDRTTNLGLMSPALYH